ncbi:DlpA domain-containing protein [Corynespora cassiicola Philippines]|uniref:DlpA domain-containing protein n=1 Tax=Corynespora cassiicola Philippines TaxID=1448308 RepID=A0A2T2P7X3_CORCC|nr:DlpA domain-containing protein [Corynespora cassiicola Philippines]
MSAPRWRELSKYSACDLADALLKLKVPGAGFLADIKPAPHTADVSKPIPSKVLAPASTFYMISKASPSFPSPRAMPESIPESNLVDGTPYADYTQTDTVVVISQPPGQSCAVVGGIMAARMEHLGAQGVVVDGRVRDLVSLSELNLPVWAKGTSIIGAGAETKFHARNVPVQIGAVSVAPGDIIMIDPSENGVVSVPQALVDDVLELLPQLVGADEKVIADVETGVSVKEAFQRHRG